MSSEMYEMGRCMFIEYAMAQCDAVPSRTAARKQWALMLNEDRQHWAALAQAAVDAVDRRLRRRVLGVL